MFKWFRKKNDPENQAPADETLEAAAPEADSPEEAETRPRAMEPDSEADTNPSPAAQEPASEEVPADQAAEADHGEPDGDDPAQAEQAADDEPEETSATVEEAEPESAPESSRKGFFARLFGAKPEEEPQAEEDLADQQADAADVHDYLETVAVEDDLAEASLTAEDAADDDADADAAPVGAVEAESVESEAQQAPEPESVEAEAQEAAKPESVEAEAQEAAKPEGVESEASAPAEAADAEASPRKGIFAKFKDKLSATRDRLAGRIETLLSSVRTIDEDVLDELEELLITSDLGVKTTTDLLYKIRGQVAASELRDTEALKQALKKRMSEMLSVPVKPLPQVSPLVIMVVGINGVGKTTTIAKLCKRIQAEGKKVLLAAGDTFRSAAVEQLTVWAERLGADIVSQPTGSKSSAVTFDAISAAQTRGRDVVIIDTAGRLHTKVNLMDELKKIKRVAGKAMDGAPHHTILVLDGNTGQNALLQAQAFQEAVGVDSIIMTKLDGTAKGGVIVSIANELKIPITHIGLGESFDDLQPFDPEAFTEAILS